MFTKKIINRVFVRSLAIAAVTLMLSACSSGIEGTYSGSGKTAGGFADVSIEAIFHADTVMVKTSMSTMGMTAGKNAMESEYKLDGNKIKIKHVKGMSNIWTLEDDGSISVPTQGAGIIKLTQTNDASADSSTGKHETVTKDEDSSFSFSRFIARLTGSGPEGTYSGKFQNQKTGVSLQLQLIFHSDHKVTMKSSASMRGRTIFGKEGEGEYELDGNKIKIKEANDVTEIFTLEDNGSITSRSPDGDIMILTQTNDARAQSSSGKHEAVAEAEDSGFSFSKFIAGIFAPDVEGTYIFTAPKTSVKFAGLLTLKLESGKAFLTMKQDSKQTEEAGTYAVDEKDDKKVKIKGAHGQTDIFILGDDGSLMPPPGYTAGPKFIRADS